MYQREIESRKQLVNDERNLFVQAGAGAGKTTSLVQRIVNSLEAGAKPSEIVAISFPTKDLTELTVTLLLGSAKTKTCSS